MHNSKPGILYLMHVDWSLIKQRPHFLAEGLAEHFDVTVLHNSQRYKTANFVDNSTTNARVAALPNIPAQRYGFIRKLNVELRRRVIKSTLENTQANFLWITHPLLVEFLPKNIDCKIVYDCMDDALGFQLRGPVSHDRMLQFEKRLLRISDHVFVSSEHLAKVISEREPCNDKLSLVRNAFDGKILDPADTQTSATDHDRFRIGYFGTVAEWFDFDALDYCLRAHPDIEIEIVGPLHNASPFDNERLKLVGAINHSELPLYAKRWDCLVMPFKVTELIKSVDPVKLYEYINFNKPIIAVDYPEIRRFEPFADFYSTAEELADRIAAVKNNLAPKYSLEERERFLNDNSWKQRLESITKQLI